MGRVVRDHGNVPGPGAEFQRNTDRTRLRRDRDRGDDLAVLRRDDRRSILRYRARPRGTASRRRGAPIRRVPRQFVWHLLPVADRVCAVLHADAGAQQLVVVRPPAQPGARIPASPGAGNGRVDRGGTTRWATGTRAHGDSAASGGRRVARARRLLHGVATHTAARRRSAAPGP